MTWRALSVSPYGTVLATDFVFNNGAAVVLNAANITGGGDFVVGADVFTVSGISGNTSTNGTLDVAGITTLADDLHLSANTSALMHTVGTDE
jgi:hypothetical protein